MTDIRMCVYKSLWRYLKESQHIPCRALKTVLFLIESLSVGPVLYSCNCIDVVDIRHHLVQDYQHSLLSKYLTTIFSIYVPTWMTISTCMCLPVHICVHACMHGSILYKENHTVEHSPLYPALHVHHENIES